MGIFYLIVAIIAEVIATSALKSSQEFTRLIPSMIVVLGYGLATYCFALVLKTISIGVAYAVWTGMGIALITLVGIMFFEQSHDLPAIIGISLILLGVLIINLFSKTVSH